MSVKNPRQAILDRLAALPLQPTAPAGQPRIDPRRLVQYDDPLAKFSEMLGHVGGTPQRVAQLQQVASGLAQLPGFGTARRIVSLLPEAAAGNFDLAQVDDPHSLASIDWAIAPARFAVAENGALWVQPADVTQRALLFLTQHLVLVTPADQVVMQMHDAYRRLRQERFGMPDGDAGPLPFGVFISGPSKTADIEQSLVIGAHGCRTLDVFLVG